MTHTCLALTKEEAKQMLALMDRALNTLPPDKWPSWAETYIRQLQEFTESRAA